MPIRVFVAMAFDHNDTDELFDLSLDPVVSEVVGSRARRVDRVEHNDDIDDRIMAELAASDVVIADLTYARPSVYFEAGWAAKHHGRVIYTARRDHLSRDASDGERVHFDLQMKNIIIWSEADSPDFRRRLKARLRLVTEPIRRQQSHAQAQRHEVETFANLSVAQRLSEATASAVTTLEAEGFRRVDRDAVGRFSGLPNDVNWVGERRNRGVVMGVRVFAAESFTQKWIERLTWAARRVGPFNVAPIGGQPIRALSDICILISTRSVPDSRIQTAIPVAQVEQTGRLVYESPLAIPTRPLPGYRRFVFREPQDQRLFRAYRAEGDWHGLLVGDSPWTGGPTGWFRRHIYRSESTTIPLSLKWLNVSPVKSSRDVTNALAGAFDPTK